MPVCILLHMAMNILRLLESRSTGVRSRLKFIKDFGFYLLQGLVNSAEMAKELDLERLVAGVPCLISLSSRF